MSNDTQNNHDRRERAAAGAADRPRHRSSLVRKLLRATVVAVVVGPPVATFVLVAAIPAARLARQSTSASPAAVERQTKGRGESRASTRDNSLRLLGFDEAYWKSRLALAKQEPISLAVDLVDSTATLDIRGVPVRNCRIHRIEMSGAVPFLETTSDFRDRLSKPLAIAHETGTLPKEPIRVEMAPKDTIEAIKAAARPLAPEEVDVYFTLVLDGGLELAVRQLEKPSTPDGSRKKKWMDMKDNLDQARKAVRSLVRSELPQHEPRIEVTLAREDAKAIYRALGPKARVALRL